MRALRERIPTARRYYRLTGGSFRALCPEASGHMNMGLWPAASLREAQERLVHLALERGRAAHHRSSPVDPRGILDLGSGWGGSRALFHAAFPRSPYVGVNVDPDQLAVARAATAAIPRTTYVEARVEDHDALPWEGIDAAFALESAFHFEEKDALIEEAARRGIRSFTLLEICVDGSSDVARDPLLAPSIGHAWSEGAYRRAFARARFDAVAMEDLSDRVFPGFLAYLESVGRDGGPAYAGRRAILAQLRLATEALAAAAARGEVRYLAIAAARG